MYDLTRFTLGDMAECGATLRKLGTITQRIEEVADRIVRYLYEELREKQSGARACALVRCFKTHPYGLLDADLQTHARRLLGDQPAGSAMKCLTLLATAGIQPEWNLRQASLGHQAIPLPSAAIVAQSPMIAQLVHQFGLEVPTLLAPDPK